VLLRDADRGAPKPIVAISHNDMQALFVRSSQCGRVNSSKSILFFGHDALLKEGAALTHPPTDPRLFPPTSPALAEPWPMSTKHPRRKASHHDRSAPGSFVTHRIVRVPSFSIFRRIFSFSHYLTPLLSTITPPPHRSIPTLSPSFSLPLVLLSPSSVVSFCSLPCFFPPLL